MKRRGHIPMEACYALVLSVMFHVSFVAVVALFEILGDQAETAPRIQMTHGLTAADMPAVFIARNIELEPPEPPREIPRPEPPPPRPVEEPAEVESSLPPEPPPQPRPHVAEEVRQVLKEVAVAATEELEDWTQRAQDSLQRLEALRKAASPPRELSGPVSASQENETVPPEPPVPSVEKEPSPPVVQLPPSPPPSIGEVGVTRGAEPIEAIQPEYPSSCIRRGQHGLVVVEAHVRAEGTVREVRIDQSSGYDRLDQAAADAVSQARFIPARRNGRAVDAWVKVPVRFVLKE